MPKASKADDETGSQANISSRASAPDHLTVTVSGPPEHVKAALTNMRIVQPVTPLLCQQIALAQTNYPGATALSTLLGLGFVSPQLKTAYAQRCVLDLKMETGVSVAASKLPQKDDTAVEQVAEAMFDATT